MSVRTTYDNFCARDTYAQISQFWIESSEISLLKEGVPHTDLRRRIMKQLLGIQIFLPLSVLEKYYSYERRKYEPIEEPAKYIHLQVAAMDNMASLFALYYMNGLLEQTHIIRKSIITLQQHYGQFLAYLSSPPDLGQHMIQPLMHDLQTAKKQLFIDHTNLNAQISKLFKKIRLCKAKAKRFGEAYYATPKEFFERHTFVLSKPSTDDLIFTTDIGSDDETAEKALVQMETIKQEESTAKGADHFYISLENTLHAIRNMERGMLNYLRHQPNAAIPSQAKLTEPNILLELIPDKQLEDEILSLITCPLSGKRFKDPVTLQTGYTFEREAITKHLEEELTCPISGKKLFCEILIPNLAIKSIATRMPSSMSLDQFFQTMPEFLSCQSHKLLQIPILVSSGMTYDQEDLAVLLVKGGICPVTRIPLENNVAILNQALDQLMKASKKWSLQIGFVSP